MNGSRQRLWMLMALLPLACGLPAPRVVDDPSLGRAIKIAEDRSPRMTLSPSDELLLVESWPSGHDDGYATRVFDTRSLALLWSAPVRGAGFDAEGRRVLLQLDDRFEIREARSGRLLRRFRREEPELAAFVGAGRLAIGGAGRLALFDADSGRPTDQLALPGQLLAPVRATADGKRILLELGGQAGAPAVLVFDYPGFRPRCQTPWATLSPDGGTLALASLERQDTLLVDATSCAPRLRTCLLDGGPSVDGKAWFSVQRLEQERGRLLALQVPLGRWELGPELRPRPSALVAGSREIALQHSTIGARFFRLRPLDTRLWRAATHAGDKLRTYRWLPCPGTPGERGDEPPGPVSGGTFEDSRLALRVLPGRGRDLVLQLTNRDPKPLRVDWARSALVVIREGSPSTSRRLWLGHMGCFRFDAAHGDSPCAPTDILPGSGYVDVLHGRARPDDAQLFELAPRCGDRIALELAVASPGQAPRTLRVELRYCEVRRASRPSG